MVGDPELGARVDAYLAAPAGSNWQKLGEGLLQNEETVVLPLLRGTATAIRSYGMNAPQSIVMRPIDYSVRILSALAQTAHRPLIEGLSDTSESVRALSGFMLTLPMIEVPSDVPLLVKMFYDDDSPTAKLGAASNLLVSPFLDDQTCQTLVGLLRPWADQEFPDWADGPGPTAQALARITLQLMFANLRSAS